MCKKYIYILFTPFQPNAFNFYWKQTESQMTHFCFSLSTIILFLYFEEQQNEVW